MYEEKQIEPMRHPKKVASISSGLMARLDQPQRPSQVQGTKVSGDDLKLRYWRCCWPDKDEAADTCQNDNYFQQDLIALVHGMLWTYH